MNSVILKSLSFEKRLSMTAKTHPSTIAFPSSDGIASITELNLPVPANPHGATKTFIKMV